MPDHDESTAHVLDRSRPGIYVVPSRSFAETLLMDARAEGLATARIDLALATTKAAVLAEFARRLGFPAYFGHNWDAFDECFRDLAWQPVPGHAFLVAGFDGFAAAAPDDWRIALRIFTSAGDEWAQARRALYVFLQGSPDAAPSVPALSPGNDAADERR